MQGVNLVIFIGPIKSESQNRKIVSSSDNRRRMIPRHHRSVKTILHLLYEHIYSTARCSEELSFLPRQGIQCSRSIERVQKRGTTPFILIIFFLHDLNNPPQFPSTSSTSTGVSWLCVPSPIVRNTTKEKSSFEGDDIIVAIAFVLYFLEQFELTWVVLTLSLSHK